MLAVAAMAFTACTTDITDDVVKNETVEYNTPLEFGMDVELSRAFMDDEITIQFEEGDEVGVYVIPADASATATKNAKGTIRMVNGSPRVSVDVASFAAGDKVLAYHPYSTLNDSNEANSISLVIKEVQVQPELGKINCDYMPMVSVATDLAAASGETILFRPVASVMKLNIYSDMDEHQGATIRRIKFGAEKHEDVTGCNYCVGIRKAFDLTTVTEDSAIEVAVDGATRTTSYDAQVYAYTAYADYNEDGPTVAATSTEANPVYLIFFPGEYGGPKWDSGNQSYIQIHTDEHGRFDLKIASETPYTFDRAIIKPFNINLANTTNYAGVDVEYIHRNAIEYGTKTNSTGSTIGARADQMLAEELIVIGSGTECLNMREAKLTNWSVLDFSANTRTVYAQTLDGTAGFRFAYYTAGQNTLKRGDKIKLQCGSLEIYKTKVADGEWEYWFDKLSPSNIFKLTPGCEDEIVTKEKYISELTAADLNTDVKLKDMEFLLKDAPYVYGYTSSGVVGTLRDQSATMMQDKNDDAIFILINSKCTWKRDLTAKIKVPQGKGSVHGVLVHTTDKSYANNGNIGKFQLRPFDQTSFDMTTTKESAVNEVVSWRLDKSTFSLSQYAWNGQTTAGGFVSTSQPAGGQTNQNKMVGLVNGAWDAATALYATNLTVIASGSVIASDYPVFILSAGELTSSGNYGKYTNPAWHPNAADGMTNTGEHAFSLTQAADYQCGANCRSLVYNHDVASYYGWDEDGTWDGTTTGIVAEFAGADKEMSISFNIGNLCPGKTKNNAYEAKHRWRGLTFGFPLYWKVECSTDNGTTWTACTNAINGEDIFKMNPTMRWTKDTAFTSPKDGTTTVTANTPDDHCHAYVQQKFVLPATAIGAAKVMVKISPASLRLAWFGKSSEDATYTDTSDVDGFDCTKDYKYIHSLMLEDVVVTTAAE